jgi:hypothetical protein
MENSLQGPENDNFIREQHSEDEEDNHDTFGNAE